MILNFPPGFRLVLYFSVFCFKTYLSGLIFSSYPVLCLFGTFDSVFPIVFSASPLSFQSVQTLTPVHFPDLFYMGQANFWKSARSVLAELCNWLRSVLIATCFSTARFAAGDNRACEEDMASVNKHTPQSSPKWCKQSVKDLYSCSHLSLQYNSFDSPYQSYCFKKTMPDWDT